MPRTDAPRTYVGPLIGGPRDGETFAHYDSWIQVDAGECPALMRGANSFLGCYIWNENRGGFLWHAKETFRLQN